MLHYYAKDFFAPVIISPERNGDDLSLYVISDLLIPLTELQLTISVHKWTSFDVLKTEVISIANHVSEDSH